MCLPCHSAMATRRKRSSAPADSPAARKKRMVVLETTNICTYWPNNPPFDPKRVLLRRLFFINEDRNNYVSVSFYSARDYLTPVEFGVLRRCGGPKTLILCDEQVDALVETLPTLREEMCCGEAGGSQVREWCPTAGCYTQWANGPSIRRFTVHFSNFTGYRIFVSHVQYCATIARLYRGTSRRFAVCYSHFNFSDLCGTSSRS